MKAANDGTYIFVSRHNTILICIWSMEFAHCHECY